MLGPIGARIPAGRLTPLYQLEYHMKITMKSRLRMPSIPAAAAFAFWLAGAPLVQAEEALAPPGQDMVLVPAKVVQTLEQRVIFLEETVAALTESWQHIDTHRLCIFDDSSETCITKPQLDMLLAKLAQAETGPPAPLQHASAAATDAPPPAQPVEIAAAPSEPATEVGDNSVRDQDSEPTGTLQPAITGAAVLSYPKVEIYEDPVARSDD
jgi:hypothetical protein